MANLSSNKINYSNILQEFNNSSDLTKSPKDMVKSDSDVSISPMSTVRIVSLNETQQGGGISESSSSFDSAFVPRIISADANLTSSDVGTVNRIATDNLSATSDVFADSNLLRKYVSNNTDNLTSDVQTELNALDTAHLSATSSNINAQRKYVANNNGTEEFYTTTIFNEQSASQTQGLFKDIERGAAKLASYIGNALK